LGTNHQSFGQENLGQEDSGGRGLKIFLPLIFLPNFVWGLFPFGSILPPKLGHSISLSQRGADLCALAP
jgi:hypothetical protein